MADKNHATVHWSQLDEEAQVRFWQRVDTGEITSFLVSESGDPVHLPLKKPTKRRRGNHSTKPKCENPLWFRPSHYRTLGGQLGYAYNRLVKTDKATGTTQIRIHMSRHPIYVQGRIEAGRKYAFRPEKQRLLDAMWPVLISFCDAGKHSVGMCVSRLARELSPKDSKGNVIKDQEITVPRISRLLKEQIRFGLLDVLRELEWDRAAKQWLPKYVWITEKGFRALGVDLVKLAKEQEKALRRCEERHQLIEMGLMTEDEDISPQAARRRWAEKMTSQALKRRRELAAKRKRANRLAKLPWDAQVHEMATHILKSMPADEAYYCSSDRLEKLAIQQLYQMELFQSGVPPA
ncbi:MAG: plasmid replication initiator RepA [Mixta calida]|uniref:plasmid replication initiator RepA n=1 Tax=Mixta calida TaxID=665913 RepID=UPI002910DA87|nr:plasmid replication initiator RepA [Mixta calida]MDU3818624.1 plasmid replication initiator RepA [Pantoea sp.]MDU4943523.1 plasmid replication initiator RepA [Mixta calida]MDU5189505.1 plasmid replication initiator RepA [Mixta calida]